MTITQVGFIGLGNMGSPDGGDISPRRASR